MTAPEPLTQPECERLWRWERLMIRFYAVATGLIVVGCLLALSYGETAWVRRSLLGMTVVLVLAATVLLYRERCPRCHARLRLKSGFMLPDKCPACGVAYGRPPRRGML
jgi:hypothetical protein